MREKKVEREQERAKRADRRTDTENNTLNDAFFFCHAQCICFETSLSLLLNNCFLWAKYAWKYRAIWSPLSRNASINCKATLSITDTCSHFHSICQKSKESVWSVKRAREYEWVRMRSCVPFSDFLSLSENRCIAYTKLLLCLNACAWNHTHVYLAQIKAS